MKRLLCLLVCCTLMACAPYKPPLEDTQVVNGESIVVPPNFDKLPKESQ